MNAVRFRLLDFEVIGEPPPENEPVRVYQMPNGTLVATGNWITNALRFRVPLEVVLLRAEGPREEYLVVGIGLGDKMAGEEFLIYYSGGKTMRGHLWAATQWHDRPPLPQYLTRLTSGPVPFVGSLDVHQVTFAPR